MAEQDRPEGNGSYRPPPYQLQTWGALSAAVIIVLGLVSVRFAQNPETPRPGALRPLPDDGALVLADHELESDYWPCSDCHGGEPPNYEVRKLVEDHEDIELTHGTLWCLDCHFAPDRDKLHLAGCEQIEFRESWRLCTQCHGTKLEDWRAGVHGKWSGNWRGDRTYVTCVECHNPHHPPFQGIEPLPPPKPPTQIVLPGTEVATAPPAGEGESHE